MNLLYSLFLLLTSLAGKNDDLPEPYNQVRLLPYNPQGWYSNGVQLAALIRDSVERKLNVKAEGNFWRVL